MADNIPVTAGSGTTVASDDISGVHYQRFKPTHGVDGSATDVSTASPLPVRVVSGTATLSNVSGSASSVTLLSAAAGRLGASIYNDSTAVLYVKLGTTASSTSFTLKMAADSYYEVPAGFTGRIDGIWASATGTARVTELT